jgi:hypothetical protein
LFDSEEHLLEHLEDFGFDKSPILIELDRFYEAAEIQMQNSNRVAAIELYLRDGGDNALSKAEKCILDELWSALPYGTLNLETRKQSVMRTLDLAKQIPRAPERWTREVSK